MELGKSRLHQTGTDKLAVANMLFLTTTTLIAATGQSGARCAVVQLVRHAFERTVR